MHRMIIDFPVLSPICYKFTSKLLPFVKKAEKAMFSVGSGLTFKYRAWSWNILMDDRIMIGLYTEKTKR